LRTGFVSSIPCPAIESLFFEISIVPVVTTAIGFLRLANALLSYT